MYNNSEREVEHLKGLYGVVEDWHAKVICTNHIITNDFL